ncbi:acyl carrier protein [Rufibacter soli]
METTEILKKVNDIFKSVLEDDTLVIEKETTADDVDDWDSLNHIVLVVEIEKQFGIKFTANEIVSFKNVGEMNEAIKKKLGS